MSVWTKYSLLVFFWLPGVFTTVDLLGFLLPLGRKNHPYSLKSRGEPLKQLKTFRTPGSLDSPVVNTPGSSDFPAVNTPRSSICDSPAISTPGSRFYSAVNTPEGRICDSTVHEYTGQLGLPGGEYRVSNSVADPGCLSQIRMFFDPGFNKKRAGKKETSGSTCFGWKLFYLLNRHKKNLESIDTEFKYS